MTTITDQMIETAARAIARNWGLNPDDLDHEHFHGDAIAALEAVAPLITAQALRDAANAPLCANVPDGEICLSCDARMFLREAANQIEAGQ